MIQEITEFAPGQKRLGILFGGCSSEYEVSLQSAFGILSHLRGEGFVPVLIGLERTGGQWYWYRGDAARIPADSWFSAADCLPVCPATSKADHGLWCATPEGLRLLRLSAALPVLHGKNGEDGTVQGALELAGIPVLGCGVLASAVCMDKDVAHRLAAAAGVRVPRSVVLRRPAAEECRTPKGDLPQVVTTSEAGAAGRMAKGDPPQTVTANGAGAANGPAAGKAAAQAVLPQAQAAAVQLGLPLFVKPVRAGSSFGVTKVAQAQDLPAALAAAFCHDDEVLLEEAVPGFEVGCAVLGNDQPLTGAIDEIELSGGFFDYTEKYTLKTSRIQLPARLSAAKTEEVRQAALTVYRALKCRGFARVDLFVTPAGDVLFNEVNTIPGFTAHSRYPGMLQAAGIPFAETLARILRTEVW